MDPNSEIDIPGDTLHYTPEERDLFYRVIAARRDIRKFRPDPVPDEALARILWAAHHAGSVGFMQPWNFLLIRDLETRLAVKNLFTQANAVAAHVYTGERRQLYDRLKLEGILESPLNICVTCDTRRGGPHVLGRNSIRETDVYSTCTAIQNLWLAARVEGIGVGWVSIIDNDQIRDLLRLPRQVVPVAYLCVGYPEEFAPQPELEQCGWRGRLDLDDLVYHEKWPIEERTARESEAACDPDAD